MNEALTLFAALLSALATAVGTLITVAQWRATRRRETPADVRLTRTDIQAPTARVGPPATERAPVTPLAAGQAESPPALASQQPSRAAVVAVVFGTVCFAFTAVMEFAYWSQQAADDGSGWEPIVDATFAVGVLASIAAMTLALWSVGAGLVRHNRPTLRLAIFAFIGSLTPWVGFWLTDLINDSTLT